MAGRWLPRVSRCSWCVSLHFYLSFILFPSHAGYGVSLPVYIRLPVSHIGFDLVDVGKDEVTVRTGKQSSKKVIQYAVQALAVLFNTSEAPRLGLSSASSLESLNSSHSSSNTTTTSNFSKDSSTPHDSSTPPSSPHSKYYSPAGKLIRPSLVRGVTYNLFSPLHLL